MSVLATVDHGDPRAVAEYALECLTEVAEDGMVGVAGVAAKLDGVLRPARVRAPFPGQAVLVCSGCGHAVDSAQLRWWPRPKGAGTHPRIGCVSCVVSNVEPGRCTS